MTNYILKNKKVVAVKDVLDWAKWFEKADRIVEQTELPNGYFVSTVFLGTDYSFGLGKPLVFETMVFKGTKKEFTGDEQDMMRYTTYEEAEKGHKTMVNKWKKV